MKIAILGDTHFGAKNDSVILHSHMEKFYKDIFFPYLKEHQIDTIIQLGDLFDKKKGVNFLTLTNSKDYFFDMCAKESITLHINVGNHDTYFKNTNEINAANLLLNEYKNIQVYTNPLDIEIGGCGFLIIPWICSDNQERVETLIKNTKAQIAIGHLELSGFAMYQGGALNAHGQDPNIFSKFDMVLTGHYHHKSTNNNIHYLGTPYELTWSDYNDQKGFHIFDTDTRELTFIKNPYILHNKILYDDEGKDLDDILNISDDLFKDCYVKVVVLNKTNPYYLDLFVKKLEDDGAIDVKVVENPLVMELNNIEVGEVEDTITILHTVVDEVDTSIPKEDLKGLLTSLYYEAEGLEKE